MCRIGTPALKILLVGGYPPPYGGVTVHIQRLQHFLINSGLTCMVINHFDNGDSVSAGVINLHGNRFSKYFKLWTVIANSNAQIVHFHFSKLGNFIIGGKSIVKAAGKAIRLATIHSGQFTMEFYQRDRFYRILTVNLLKTFDHFIAVNNDQIDFYTQVVGINPDQISLIPTFILPAQTQFTLDPAMASQVAELKKQCRWILMASGYLLPYYGFDLFLEAVTKLEEQFKVNFGLIFVFYTLSDEKYHRALMTKISNRPHTLIYENITPETFLGLLKQSDVFVRPTLADSFGVSVAEALYLQTPVVASDVCPRQPGAIIFKTGDVYDLVGKIRQVLENYSDVKTKLASLTMLDNAHELLQVYYQLIEKRIK